MNSAQKTAIDLFAGCGGMTLGLRNAGFNVGAAVENDPTASATYRANHPHVNLIEEDIRKIMPETLNAAVQDQPLALIAGCAPCQTFSQLQPHRTLDNSSDLILAMESLIYFLQPRAVLMENVPGLARRGKAILDEFISRLTRQGYQVEHRIVHMEQYGVPQTRHRFILLAGHGFKIPWPEPWPRQRTVYDAIGPRHPLHWDANGPATLREAKKYPHGPQGFRWHVVRDLSKAMIARLDHIRPGETWKQEDRHMLPPCAQKEDYAWNGSNYCRMVWNKPAPTITGGCTTPAKGAFGHPDMSRYGLSVREAAMLQTFPYNYTFDTDSMNAAATMVGNAVPPLYAEQIGQQILRALEATPI